MPRSFRLALLLTALSTAPTAGALAQKKLPYPKQAPATDIYDAVEKPAEPLGGLQAYADYLGDQLNYPTAALQAGVQGTVELTFVVERTGVTSNWQVSKSLSPECDAEALRLVKAGPRWRPAEHKGGPVRQRVTLPITFQIPADGGAAPGTGSAPGAPASGSSSGASSPIASGPAPAAAAGAPETIAPDEPARPVGGTEAWFEWVQKEQKYPALARQRKVEGKVMMEFTIEKDGSLANIKPVKRLGAGLDEEAIRIIKASPKWQPARYKGQPIRQKMVLPILFQL